MMINGRSPVWHARRKKLLHMFNRWSNSFARIGTEYLHLTAGYTDIKMLIAKDLYVYRNTLVEFAAYFSTRSVCLIRY